MEDIKERYHTFYSLDDMVEEGIRIKPKDEEEAKQVFAYLYKARARAQTQTNTIKEENKMLCLVEIYKERKEAQIEDKASIARDKAFDKDPTIKALRDLKTKSKMSDGSYMFTYKICNTPDIVKKETDKINENEARETRELNELIDEVNSQLAICENYDQKIAILKGYHILDESGRINV